LSKEEERGVLIEGCRRLEQATLHLFGSAEWKIHKTIEAQG
jgi:hypothetical protein